MPNADGSSNVRVNKQRYEKLRKARLELMVNGYDEIRIAELIGMLIDQYLDEACRDLKHKIK